MSASGPPPECAPDFVVRPVERLFGRAVLVVVGPATNDGVQQANQQGLADRFVRVDDSPDFLQERVRVLLRWFHEWFAIVATEVLSEEVEAFVDVREACLVGGERQPSFFQERFDQGTHFIFQQLLRVAGDDEVVRISDEVDLGLPRFAISPRSSGEVCG
jgi:hypothetical protein